MNSTLSSYQRRAIIIFYDLFCVSICYYLAFCIRFDSLVFSEFKAPNFVFILILNVSIQSTTIFLMGIHKGVWRFASTHDLLLIIKSVSAAIVLSLLVTFFYNRLNETPRFVYIIDYLLLIVGLCGGRFTYRLLKIKNSKNTQKNALMIGAGFSGEKLAREFKRTPQDFDFNIVGILDDDKQFKGRTIHGINVLGTTRDIELLAPKRSIETILIAIPTASNQFIKRIYETTKSLNISARTLPQVSDLYCGKVSFNQMREVQVEDLMGRNLADLDLNSIANSHNEKTILVTGAGGSIGSELCRQILHYKPTTLIMIDHSEFNIYEVSEEFAAISTSTELIYKTISINNIIELNEVFSDYRPDIVYHAAAYKHVPIMEKNPKAAIHTNIKGTENVASLSLKYDVQKFILVSTDKAVNPTNVMGASKRIAEMICEKLNSYNKTKFSMVRFGNVLGSSGSVIPKFKKQINRGGPVTITHPDITRFFMAISEAAQLVIQAGVLSKGGEIFVLDMGSPVKILDLAKDLITLSGHKPDVDIEIQFTGLRPGEKLYEELLSDKEETLPTTHKMVKVARSRALPDHFDETVKDLLNIESNISRNQVKKMIHRLVEEYTPQFEQTNDKERRLQ